MKTREEIAKLVNTELFFASSASMIRILALVLEVLLDIRDKRK